MNLLKSFVRSFKWFLVGGALMAAGTVAAVNISVPSAPIGSNNYTLTSTTTGAYIPSQGLATSTNQIYINSARTDTYVANGTVAFPYKSITAANAAVSAAGLTNNAYYIAPGTYSEQTQTFPNTPLVIHGNGATILVLSGASVGAGLFTFPSDITWYDPVVFGNIAYTSTSLSNPHTMINPFIAGNVFYSGLAFISNGAVVNQDKGVFPFLAASSTSGVYGTTGALINITGSQIQVPVVARGAFLNLDDVGVFAASTTSYAVDASTAGSQLAINGATIINYFTGGGINCSNTATAATPNEMTNFSVTVAVGTVSDHAINCGTAISYAQMYIATDFLGKQYFANPLNSTTLRALENVALNVEGNSYLNVISGGKTGFGSSTPNGDVAIHLNNGDTSRIAFLIGSSTATATSTLFSIGNTGSIFTALGNGCVQAASGFLTSTGVACGSGGGSGGFGEAWKIITATPLNYLAPSTTLGILTAASSTIGSGTQGTGLTISGGSTTTQNAYFALDIGVGTQNPATPIEISESDANTVVATGNAPALRLTNTNTTANNMSELSFTTNDLSGTNLRNSGITGINVSHTAGAMSGSLAFMTRNAGSYAERMRIDPTGDVGIGTTSPFAEFSINTPGGATGSKLTLMAIASSTATATTTVFSVSNTGALNATGNFNLNTSGYPQGVVGAVDASPNFNLEVNSQGQGPYTSIGLKNGTQAGGMVLDTTDSFNGQTNFLTLTNINSPMTCLGFSNQTLGCAYSDNGLDTLVDFYPPSGGDEMTYTNSLPQGNGTNFRDTYLMNYGAATGLISGTITASTKYAQPLASIVDGFWEQQNGNTSEASSSWNYFVASTSPFGSNGTTSVVGLGDIGTSTYSNTFGWNNGINLNGATVQIVASTSRFQALGVYRGGIATSTQLFGVYASGIASSSAFTISGTPNCSGSNALTTNSAGAMVCGAISGSGNSTFGTSSLSAVYPIVYTQNTSLAQLSIAFGTTTPNTWSATQTFTVSPVFSTLGAGTVNSLANGTLYNTATSTPTVTAPIAYSGTLGSFIGGSGGAFSINSNGITPALFQQGGANTIFGNPTGATANGQYFSTSSLYAAALGGRVLGYNSDGTIGPQATTTFTNGTGITLSTAGNALTIANNGVVSLVNGTGIACSGGAGGSGSCSFGNQSANTVLTNQSGSAGVPTGEATSTFGNTLYGTGQPGQVLSWNNGVPQWVASSTMTQGTGITVTMTGNNTQITNSGVTSNVAGAGISLSGSTGAVTITNTIGYAFPSNATTTLLSFYGNASTSLFTATSSTYLASVSGSVAIGATSTPGSILAIQGVANFVANAVSTFYNGLRILGELVIPNSLAPTLANIGDIAINTTAASSSLRYNDGVATRSLFPDKDSVFSFASSTLQYEGKFGAAGTTTILLGNYNRPTTLVNFFCKTDVGTAFVRFGNGTASTTQTQCTTAGTEVGVPTASALTNNTWKRRQNFIVELGTSASNPGIITVTADIRQDAD